MGRSFFRFVTVHVLDRRMDEQDIFLMAYSMQRGKNVFIT